MLNGLREGFYINEDIVLLKRNLIEYENDEIKMFLYLFVIRFDVLEYNFKVFYEVYEFEKIIVEIIDFILGDMFVLLKEKIFLKVFIDSIKIKGLLKLFCLVENFYFEFIHNVDILDGLINGILCIIKKIRL